MRIILITVTMLLFVIGCGPVAENPVVSESDTPDTHQADMQATIDLLNIDTDNLEVADYTQAIIDAVTEANGLPMRTLQVNDKYCEDTFYDPFPMELRGTSMTLDEQNQYISGHIVIGIFGTFGEISSNGYTGCDFYLSIYDWFDDLNVIYANFPPFYGYTPMLVDIQETNRWGMYGTGGFDCPETWAEDPCPLDIPCVM